MTKKKIIRTATIALSLDVLLKGQLAFLNKQYEVIAVAGQDTHLEIVNDREKVQTRNVSMQRNISPFKDIVSLLKLYLLFKKEKPQLVHSITPKAGLLSMIAAKYAGVPIRIHTFTGLIFPSKKGFIQKLLIFMDKVLCWHATHIYPEGNGVKNDLLHYKITKKPLQVIANGNVNGIDKAYFNPNSINKIEIQDLKNQLNISNQDFVFIFVGRLVKDKGINELIAAFLNLKPETLNLKLLLVGSFENELDPLNVNTLESIKNNSTIISVGYQNDVRPYFAISNCLVFPSYREGFPNVVMQAGAMGLPSIVSNINGCNEIIQEGINGTIVPAKDSKALAEAMKNIIENENLYHTFQSNARKRIVDRYEQKVVWNAILNEYKRLENNI